MISPLRGRRPSKKEEDQSLASDQKKKKINTSAHKLEIICEGEGCRDFTAVTLKALQERNAPTFAWVHDALPSWLPTFSAETLKAWGARLVFMDKDAKKFQHTDGVRRSVVGSEQPGKG